MISLSSAGAMLVAPPQAMTPPTLSVISLISSALNSTGARISIRSAVPPAPVMALELVLGMRSPAAATTGTITRDTLLPGTPPMLCLSTTGWVSKWILSPVSIMALVSHSVSWASILWMYEAVMYAESSTSLRWLSTMSLTMAFIWSSFSFCLSIIILM